MQFRHGCGEAKLRRLDLQRDDARGELESAALRLRDSLLGRAARWTTATPTPASVGAPVPIVTLPGCARAAGWDADARLTAYLKIDTPDADAADLAQKLGRELAGKAKVELIDRAQALREFERSSGLGEALALLGENPLPAALVLTPAGTADEATLARLSDRVRALPQVEDVQAEKRLKDVLLQAYLTHEAGSAEGATA